MNEDLRSRLDAYHEADEYENIVEAIEEIPAADRDYEMIGHLGRALNNLERYEEAVEQFLTVADEGKDDPLWHYRIGLAYYYLEQYENAQREFTIADQLEPGDEDTLEFLEWIRVKLEEESESEEESTESDDSAGAESSKIGESSDSDYADSDDAGQQIVESDRQTGVQADLNTAFDLAAFWEDSTEALEKYVLAPPSDELVASVEEELVFKLPAFYVQMMKIHNGGIPRNRTFPIEQGESLKSVQISSIFGIGREKSHSLCGDQGSRYLMEKEGYPEFGVIIGECPNELEVIMLDYREAGNDGEPEVVHVDRANKNRITRLAPNFEAFVQGLVK